MPFSSDDLDAWLQAIRDGLITAVGTPGHPWWRPVLATLDAGQPRTRVVILRGADTRLNLRLFTDRRSRKVGDIYRHPQVEFLFYHPDWRTQLRVEAQAVVLADTSDCSAAWQTLPEDARAGYRGVLAPGAPLEATPPPRSRPLLAVPAAERGLENFAIVDAQPSRLDCLVLRDSGNRRAIWGWCDGTWTGAWVTP